MASNRAVKNRTRAESAFDRAARSCSRRASARSRMYLDPERPGVEDIIDQIVAGVRSACTYAGRGDDPRVPRTRGRRRAEPRRLRRRAAAGYALVNLRRPVTGAARDRHRRPGRRRQDHGRSGRRPPPRPRVPRHRSDVPGRHLRRAASRACRSHDTEAVAELAREIDARRRRPRGARRRRRRHGRDPRPRRHRGRERRRRQQCRSAPSCAPSAGWARRAWRRRDRGPRHRHRSSSPTPRLKLYLTASPRVRAERRVGEVGGDVDEIEAAIAERDRLDSTRADGPLREADGAIVVDTTGLSHRRGPRPDRRAMLAMTPTSMIAPSPGGRARPAGSPTRSSARSSARFTRALDTRMSIEGREHVPRTGAFVLAPVHRSYIDTPIASLRHAPSAAVHGQGHDVEEPARSAGCCRRSGGSRSPAAPPTGRRSAVHPGARGGRAAGPVPGGRAQVRARRAAAVRRRGLRRRQGGRADRAGRHRRLRAGDAAGAHASSSRARCTS